MNTVKTLSYYMYIPYIPYSGSLAREQMFGRACASSECLKRAHEERSFCDHKIPVSTIQFAVSISRHVASRF